MFYENGFAEKQVDIYFIFPFKRQKYFFYILWIMRAYCLPKKKTFAISISPRIRHAVGAHGDMVYATGYSKSCINGTGRKVRMSRILSNKKRTRSASACPAGTKRSPVTSKCQKTARIASYDKKYLSLSPAQLVRLINAHKKKSTASSSRVSKSSPKKTTKKRKSTKKASPIPY